MMVQELVRRARRRFLGNEVLAQSAYAISVALGAVVLLLILGAQLLDWRWLVLLPAAAFALGVFRTARRLPSPYAIAQLVDRRMGLADTISTAFFFAEPRHGVLEPVCQALQVRADRLAETVRPRQAVPFTVPRAIYTVGILALIASSLFALRYGLSRKLDLRPPLARIIQHSLFGEGFEQQAALQNKKMNAKPPDLRDTMGLSIPDGNSRTPGDLDAAPDSALDSIDVPDVNNDDQTGPSPNGKSKGRTPGTDPVEGDQKESEAGENTQASAGSENSLEGPQGESQGKQQAEKSGGKQSSGAAGENSSLMARLRDAMTNLLSRMRQQSNGAGTQQPSAQAGRGKNQQAGGQKGSAGQGRQQSGGQEGADAQEGQPGDDARNAQNALGRGSGPSSDQQASKQPGSGIGRQDGSKDVKLAEQLAAMGKISEIIGKRSANVTGEVTVEVSSGNQQLRTPYSQSKAAHADAGGEISRDEVPVALQPYVQEYFEQVRKQPGETRPPAKPSSQRPR
jgi:hypothetical protein